MGLVDARFEWKRLRGEGGGRGEDCDGDGNERVVRLW